MNRISSFKAPNVIYGIEVSSQAGEQARALGQKALLVTDSALDKMGILDGIKDSLKGARVDFTVFDEVSSEPVMKFVEDGLKVFKESGCDMVISIGGGSAIDTGKGISIMAGNVGSIRDFEGINKISRPGAPHMAIPTTAGTGSEVTAATIITDTERDVKMLIISPHLVPRVALDDPLLTMKMPKHVTASTGLDALTHAIEAYVSVKAHPLTDALALHAIELIARNLPQAWSDGTNLEARANMSVAALEAGLAFSNSSVALVHGMARPLGAYFHIPHGLANAALLGTVVEFSILGNPAKYADIARAMGENPHACTFIDGAYLAAKAVKELVSRLEIPSLSGLGVERQKFEQVVEQMAKDALASGSPDNNPRKASQGDIVELYRKAY